MPIIVIGVNHKTASVDIREKVAFSPDQTGKALQSTLSLVDESLILSTCNRTEIYAVSSSETNTPDELSRWLADFHQLEAHQLAPYIYHYNDNQAIKHAFRVASGLDSLVLGEPQILGQLKASLKTASENSSVGKTLNRLLQHAFTTAKKVRTDTEIGANAVSVAYAAVSLAKRIFSNLNKETAMLVGAGETIELVGNHLKTQGIKHIIVANRSIENARKLADKLGGEAITLTDISHHLQRADILISSTAAPLPIIGKGSVERALKLRKHKPIFMVDIAIPRDIEPEVGQLDDAYLYTVDDLQSVIEANLQSRRHAADQAELMVDEEVRNFSQWLQAQDQMKIVKNYRSKAEIIRQDTLDKSLKMLESGKTAEDTLKFLAHTLTNKLSHDATSSMNKAAHSGDLELLDAAKRLLKLD